MQFKDIKPNYPIYIFDKNEVAFIDGKVKEVSFPHPEDQNQSTLPNGMPNFNFNRMPNSNTRTVVDITIEANGKTATYVVSENAEVNYAGNIVLTTDKKFLLPELESLKNSAEQYLSNVGSMQETLKRATKLLEDNNPTFKQQQANNQRLNKMEGDIGELKEMFKQQNDMFANFIKEFKS